MDISWIQALLFAFCAFLFSDVGALGPTIGTFTFSRPIVASLIVGLVLGDIPTAIMVGAAIQVVYIALVTPGGTMSADLRAVSYIGIPLAVVAVKSAGLPADSIMAAGLAVSIGTLVGSIGTLMYYMTATLNIALPSYAWKGVDKYKFKSLYVANFILPCIPHFLLSFLPTLFITKYGSGVITNLHHWLPLDGVFMKTLFTVGTMLPAVGIGILLAQVIKKPLELITFFFGFTLAAAMNINLLGAAVIGAMIALLNYKILMSTGSSGNILSEDDI